MDIYTIAIPQWRKAKERDIELIDITVKSGIQLFAPEASVLWAYKRGEVTDDQYTDLYLERMRTHFRRDPGAFENLLKKDGPIALACYCTAGKFCHRHLFLSFISEIAEDNGYNLVPRGEIV